jgi:hypothetical protein
MPSCMQIAPITGMNQKTSKLSNFNYFQFGGRITPVEPADEWKVFFLPHAPIQYYMVSL